jgi:transcription elongation factor Elf1
VRELALVRNRAQPCPRCGAPTAEVVELARERDRVLLGCPRCRAEVAGRMRRVIAPSLLAC